MATDKQIEANRRNARKSTGPRTLEGKALVRLNAIKTGIYAQAEVFTPSEDPNDLAALAAEYHERFSPTTPEQCFLVDTLVSDDFLLRRFRRIEGELLTEAARDITGDFYTLGEAYGMKCDTLDRLQRRINATRKSYLKSLEALNKLRANPESVPESKAESMENQTVTPGIGFVPSAAPEPAPPAGPAASRPPQHRELFPITAVQPPISRLWKEPHAGDRAPHQAL